MYTDDDRKRARLRGKLFELILIKLLECSDFSIVDPAKEDGARVREIRADFIEFKGRGCWHQIDLPFDYKRVTPFVYPMRLLGEAKFHKKAIEKNYIREYIGVLKDIQENYFVEDGDDIKNLTKRRIEVGSYFSASGFQAEAEKLAYAHGIRTISYKSNHAVSRICKVIDILEKHYIPGQWVEEGNWKTFKSALTKYLDHSDITLGPTDDIFGLEEYFERGFENTLEELKHSICSIQSSFIGTTETGFLLHFVGFDRFPDEIFWDTDEGHCRVYYDRENNRRCFWIEFVGDYRDLRPGRFYFSPPESLDAAAVLGRKEVLDEKQRIFGKLSMAVNIHGVARNLVITMDNDWLEEVRRGYID